MPRLEWLVPVLLLILWIVSSLLQGLEKERARAHRQRSLPGSGRPPGERATRRPPTDIDRFLEEVNRRRRQAAERRPGSGGKDKSPVPTIGPVTATPQPRVSTRPASGAPPVQPIPLPPGKIPQAIPVTPVTAAAEILAVATALQKTPAQRSATAAPASAVTSSSVAAQTTPSESPPFTEWLSISDNLRTAIILHEVFGPPRARRFLGGGVMKQWG